MARRQVYHSRRRPNDWSQLCLTKWMPYWQWIHRRTTSFWQRLCPFQSTAISSQNVNHGPLSKSLPLVNLQTQPLSHHPLQRWLRRRRNEHVRPSKPRNQSRSQRNHAYPSANRVSSVQPASHGYRPGLPRRSDDLHTQRHIPETRRSDAVDDVDSGFRWMNPSALHSEADSALDWEANLQFDFAKGEFREEESWL